MKILHTGDIHLGSFPGPEKNGENLRYNDICRCLDALLEGVVQQRPNIAIIAGDVFHQAKVWSDRGLKENQRIVEFLRDFEKICLVVVMRGTPNHDSAEQFNALCTAFAGDDSVNIITEPCVNTYHSYKGEKIQIACVPGFDRGYYRAKNPGLSKEEENEVFTESIRNIIIGLKAQCDSEIPSVLVGHYTIVGANMESGQTAFLNQFEPIVYPDTLQAANFDLVCFGHIHRPQQLQGCKNTFYSGAISALNFNDEGQKRGYYIHEICDNGIVNSSFYNLPAREFKTIYLSDDDVREINEIEAEWLYKLPVLDDPEEIKDKIVRVLYSCTDEHNKAFNHSLLEKWLYETGKAFWVQEITPQKISITVDRKKLEADDTPEENLISYLKEKDVPDSNIGNILELARPIIAEAGEKITAKKQTGLFVPVEIEVKNYRNYREEKFNYDNIKFCTINGHNGVGKSSLFMDAMIDCLFEQPREGELTGWICNDTNVRSGSIKFTFKIGENTYRVARTRTKSGKATLNISEMVEGEWYDRSKEKIRDTQAEIENILGMDSLTLKACALIMQDQYGLFLQADKEARMNILGNILGLGIYKIMGDIAAEKSTEANRDIRIQQDKINIITADLADENLLRKNISALESEIKNYTDSETAKTNLANSLKLTFNTQLETANRINRLNDRISAVSSKMEVTKQKRATQAAIMAGAELILSKEEEINDGINLYNALLEKDKQRIKIKAEYEHTCEKFSLKRQELVKAEAKANEALSELTSYKLRVIPLLKLVNKRTELEENHRKYEHIKDQIAEFEIKEQEYRSKKELVSAIKNELNMVLSENSSAEKLLNTNILSLRQRTIMLENSNCPMIENASCVFLKDALKAKKELPSLNEELKKVKADGESMAESVKIRLIEAEKEMDDLLYNPNDLTVLKANLQAAEAKEKEYLKLQSAETELKLLNERIDKLTEEQKINHDICETIKGELTIIRTKLNEINMEYMKYSALENEIAAALVWVEKGKQIPIAREQKAAAAERILEAVSEMEALNQELADIKKELAAEQANVVNTDGLKLQIEILENEIQNLRSLKEEAAIKLGGLKKQQEKINQALTEISEIQKNIAEISITAANLEILKKAFSQDGIPHNIIRSIIPIFEATASNILAQMSGGNMSVEFITEKVLKSNSKKEVTTLDIVVNDYTTGRLPYMSRSGGERVKAALSVILALSEIKSSKAGIQLGFLFIDEPPFLDEQGVQAYCDALEAIQSRYSSLKIMAITHDPAMKSRFPQSVDVIKTAEGSKLVF